jgi:predicted glutamine amidotransferase
MTQTLLILHAAPDAPDNRALTAIRLAGAAIAAYGQFNFLLSDGEHLIAYGHDRLHSQQRQEGDVRSLVIASVPLADDEPWEAFAPGELRVYRDGRLLRRWCAGVTKRCSHASA